MSEQFHQGPWLCFSTHLLSDTKAAAEIDSRSLRTAHIPLGLSPPEVMGEGGGEADAYFRLSEPVFVGGNSAVHSSLCHICLEGGSKIIVHKVLQILLAVQSRPGIPDTIPIPKP